MASLTIIRTAVCGGGDHHTVQLTAGAQVLSRVLEANDLSPVAAHELEGAILLMARIMKQLDNKNNAQIIADFIAGVTVTIVRTP